MCLFIPGRGREGDWHMKGAGMLAVILIEPLQETDLGMTQAFSLKKRIQKQNLTQCRMIF